MPDLSGLLSSDDDDQPSAVDANQNLVEVRAYAKRLEKQVRNLTKSAEDAGKKVAELELERTQTTVKGAAKARGLTDAQVDLLLGLKPQATPEEIETFATAFAVPAPGTDGIAEGDEQVIAAAAATPPPAAQSFLPVGSGNAPPVKQRTADEILAAIKSGDAGYLEKLASEAVKNPAVLDVLPGMKFVSDD